MKLKRGKSKIERSKPMDRMLVVFFDTEPKAYGGKKALPVGWVASVVTILTAGFHAHSNWIWMAGLLVAWRLAQDYVISPRIMGENLQLQPLTVILAHMV
jgi:hypothetical protein